MSSDVHQTRNRHVFVINGSSEVLEVVRRLLESERYNVTTTNFVPRTWDQIAALQPDLLMVDLVAGVQSGWNLLERLHHDAITQEIPVIIFSTDSKLLNEAPRLTQRFGGQRFIAKPFDVEELFAAVEDLIGEADPPERIE